MFITKLSNDMMQYSLAEHLEKAYCCFSNRGTTARQNLTFNMIPITPNIDNGETTDSVKDIMKARQ